jgi:UDP-N-acetylglucosamine enolpyruvyl transferase
MINIDIHGAKNLLLPLIASTILSKNIYIIHNFSQITDVMIQLKILKQFNVNVNININEKNV